MRFLLPLCLRAYDLSLRLYPASLREDFGADMSEAFRQQTAGGLAPAVWCGIKELFTIGLSPRINSPAVIAAATSLVCTSLTFLCLFWTLENPLAVSALWHGGSRAAVHCPARPRR